MKKKKAKVDIYENVTDRIITALEAGRIPWRKEWSTVGVQNFISRKGYNGINLLLLEMNGFDSPYYMTFKQAKDKGGNIKKGSKGSGIVFWKFFRNEDKETGTVKTVPMLKSYTVFNGDQIEGIDFPKDEGKQIDFTPISQAENMLKKYKTIPPIKNEKQNRAFYTPALDTITMPPKNVFSSPETYYATLFHELGHSTGHKKRLNRDMTGHFGNEKYSKEELIAELTSAFCCAVCGIDNSLKENQASYIQGWLSVLKGNKKFLIEAAGKAKKAADLIQDIKYESETLERKAA